MDRGFLSLDDFKKWMSEYNDENKNLNTSKLIGLQVESKLKPKRLIKHMLSYDGDSEDIANDFCEYGGSILEVQDPTFFLIEVDSGTFVIHRCFIKKKD